MFALNPNELGRIMAIGIMGYLALIVMLRIAGKRSLTELNAFDLVITVSLGSVFGSILLDTTVSIFDGMTAFFTLIGMQWLFSKVAMNSKSFDKLAKNKAVLLYYDGTYNLETMKKERIKKEEIIQEARMDGNSSMEQVQAVVLESNGNFSILKKDDNKESTLENLR